MDALVNKGRGYFELSPKALLWLNRNNLVYTGFKVPVNKFFRNYEQEYLHLKDWDEYRNSDLLRPNRFIVTFTPDTKNVLLTPTDKMFRTQPLLIKCWQELGLETGCVGTELVIESVPDDENAWRIMFLGPGCEIAVTKKYRL